MFSKFSSVLHQAVEVFSSGTSPEQDFISHWKAITSYFIENKDHKVSIEHTGLGHHLTCMFERLQEDDHKEKTGPCLEYTLQHKILETLATLARTDTPPGMKQEVLLFFTKLLSRLQHPLLPHVHVHKPIQRLVRLCGEQRAGPTESEEIRFLCTLCAQLKAQPHLVSFFIESTGEDPHAVCNGQNKTAVTRQPGMCKQSTVFPLVSSLLSLMHSHDARVAVKSCEGLMLICSLREPACGQAITHCTDLGKQLASKMTALYRVVPRNLSSLDVETAHAKWGFDLHMSREDDRHFPGKQQLLALLSWLDYCDELVAMAMPQVAKEVALHIREDFLSSCLKNDVLQTSEPGAITSTCILTRCVYCVHSKPLVSEFTHFFLDDVQDVSSSPSSTVSVRQRLIERCNHLSDQVSLCTLKLFDTLLLKSDIHIFDTLVLNYLVGGGYKVLNVEEVPEEVPTTPVTTTAEVPGTPRGTAEVLTTSDTAKVPGIPRGTAEVLTTSDTAEVPGTPDIAEVPNTADTTEGLGTTDTGEVPTTPITAEVPDTPRGTTEVLGTPRGSEEAPIEETSEDKEGTDCKCDTEGNENVVSGSKESASIDTTEKSDQRPHNHLDNEGGEGDGLSPQHSIETTASGVHRVVNSFLNLVPTELRTSTEAGDTGYDTYLRDAHQQYSQVCLQCKDFQWSPESHTDQHTDHTDTTAFNEGEFLKMILDRVSRLLDQSYELNLQLTSLLSKLCLLPHPAVQEYFLDPSLPLAPQCRSLYSVLVKLCCELSERVKHVPNVKTRLKVVRKQLSLYDQDVKSVEDGELLAGIITLEEFSKELAAIAFVRHHQIY